MVDKVARFSSGGMVGDIVQLVTSASTIGNVGLNAGTAEIGAVVLHTGASTIGVLGAGSNEIGSVVLHTSASTIGVLGAGTNLIGYTALQTSASTIGAVGLNAGSNEIGAVVLHTSASTIGVLGAGANLIGYVALQTSASTIGVLGAGENLIGTVGGKTTVVSASIAIAAASALYAAGDAISASPTAIITFSNCARVSGGTGWIMGGMCVDGANQTTKLDGELYVLSASPAATADNAALAWTTAETTNVLAVMPFANWYVSNAGAGSAGVCASIYNFGSPSAFVCSAGTTSLYGQLVARNAYSSANGEAFHFRIFLSQD